MALRLATLTAAAVSAGMMALSIWFLVTALTEYRTDDFLTGTETKDFTEMGTCVGTVTKEQLERSFYNKDDASCDSGHKDQVARSLMVSVHGIYHVWNKVYVGGGLTGASADADPSGVAAGWAGWDSDSKYTFGMVARWVLSAVAGGASNGCSLCEIARGGVALTTPNRKIDQIYPAINYTDAYEALLEVAEYGAVPASCDQIYGYTSLTTMNGKVLEEAGANNVRAKRFMQALVEESDDDVDKWPLGKLTIACNNEDNPVKGSYIDAQVIGPDMAIGEQQKLYLYAHCLAQFRYASVGTPVPDAGAFGIPTPGIKAGPMDGYFYDEVDGLSDLIDPWTGENYTARVRIYQGQRFGFAVWAYVPMILASTYLCADAIVFFVAEALYPIVIAENSEYTSDDLTLVRNSLVQLATRSASRRRRFAIGMFALIASLVSWFLFSVMPWGLYENRMPRPICDDNADHIGTNPEHVSEFITAFFKDTKGGWKKDWDAVFFEILTVGSQLIVFLLLPITTLGFCRPCNRGIKTGTRDYKIKTGVRKVVGRVRVSAAYRRTMSSFFGLLVLGGIVMIAGQAVSGARFGMAWASGVIGQERNDDGTVVFNEVKLAELVYNQTVATIVVTIAIGFVVGAVLQRHLIAGLGCFGSAFFFAWVILIVIFILPLLIYASVRSIFNEDEANEDCSAFPDGYDFSKGACEARFWTFLIGGGLVFLVLGLMTCLGALQALPKLLRVRTAAVVSSEDVGPRVPNHSDVQDNSVSDATQEGDSFAPAPGTVALDGKHALGGYRSGDESFYNFKTKISTGSNSTDALLYAPRIKWDLASATGRTGARYSRVAPGDN